MLRRSVYSFVIAGLVLHLPVAAAIYERDLWTSGDGLLTYDSQSNSEWLDLTETRDWATVDLAAALAPGGQYSGFRIATANEVGDLAASAGVEWVSSDLRTILQWPQTTAALELIDHLGVILDHSRPEPMDSGGDLHTFDLLDLIRARVTGGYVLIDRPLRDEVLEAKYAFVLAIGGDLGPRSLLNPQPYRYYGGISLTSAGLPDEFTGPYWLVRSSAAVPEASSAVLLILGMAYMVSHPRIRHGSSGVM